MAAANVSSAPQQQHPQFSQQYPGGLPGRQQQQQQLTPTTIRERLNHLFQRAQSLRQAGHTPETSPDLAKILKVIGDFQSQLQQHGLEQPHTAVNGHAPAASLANGSTVTNGNALTSGPIPAQPYPPSPQTPVSFTQEQIDALRSQIQAFKLLSRGLPVSEAIQQSMRAPTQAIQDLEQQLHGRDVNARIVDSAVKVHKSGSESAVDGTVPTELKTDDGEVIELAKGAFMEDDTKSGIYPYNSYMHPFSHLKRDPSTSPAVFATRLQRLLVPSIMPTGLDPHQVIAERNRFIDARIDQRIHELEEMPATMGDGGIDSVLDDAMKEDTANTSSTELALLARPPTHPAPNAHGKLRALIELKSLKVLDKQRALRALVAERLTHGSLLPLNRADFRRVRKPTIRDARMTEQAERKQRVDRERRAKQKHVEQLGVICTHGREVLATARAAQDRVVRLNRSVLQFHAQTEKEEQKRIERISKERLKALKADDEEAYMKLIDTAKDTRITHLLRQTDSYLDSLAQAVMEQQREGPNDEPYAFESEDGPATEETFGAQKFEDEQEDKSKMDYYAVAHRVKEKVTRPQGLSAERFAVDGSRQTNRDRMSQNTGLQSSRELRAWTAAAC
ncbi:hypothetical protein B0H21DRAFT_118417 [Amylocystis lapponica]|nr:hypothetical protein B0H21DRAFT_118417 [Amylocystis lapponica]